MAARKAGCCIRCGCRVEISQSAVSILLFCRTVGIAERQTSKTERLYMCSQCASILAMGPKPANGAINVSVWQIVRQLVGQDKAVMDKAWEELHQEVLSAPLALGEGEVLPPERRLKSA